MTAAVHEDLLAVDDVELGVRLLASAPTNAGRDRALLREWSERAQSYGAALAAGTADPATTDLPVVEREGGLEHGVPVVASYRSLGGGSVELFTDTVAFCEQVVDRLGWRGLFPPGSVRRAAIAHEVGHSRISGDRCAGLRRALDHQVFRWGRLRRFGFVAGADELAAHAFAGRSLGLTRSPLLITAAAMAAFTARTAREQ